MCVYICMYVHMHIHIRCVYTCIRFASTHTGVALYLTFRYPPFLFQHGQISNVSAELTTSLQNPVGLHEHFLLSLFMTVFPSKVLSQF